MSPQPSRTAQSARNVAVSVAGQLLVIVLGLVTRTVFIAQLGVAMVGVNTVLISTVALLAFADLGVSGAVMYSLYKPLSSGDTAAVTAIIRFARLLFRWIALAVAMIGLALTPFVQHLVRLEQPVEHLEVYYLVLLANTVLGYLMLDRVVLLNANQQVHITTAYSMLFNSLRSVAQIAVLLLYSSFLLFLVIQVIFTLVNNVAVYLHAARLHPHVRKRLRISSDESNGVIRSAKAMLIYRLGGLVLNNSTSVLISVIVGTVALGYYSNYLLIVGAVVMMVEVAFNAIAPSVGNLVAATEREHSRRVFDELVLASVIVHGAAAVAFVGLIDSVMLLWLGEPFVLPLDVVVAITLNFYVVGTLMPLWSFRSATGLFLQTRYIMLLTAALSIALSFVFGWMLGLIGVIIAPVIARLATGAWHEPRLLIRDHIGGSLRSYFVLHAAAFLMWGAISAAVVVASELLPTGSALGDALLKLAVILVLVPLATWSVFGRSEAFRALTRRAAGLATMFRKDPV